MNNVLDYIRWRGDLSFAQDPLNAVDAVIFSNLVYIRYPKELVTDGTLTMNQVWDAMRQREDYAQLGNPHQLELLQTAAASHRFGEVRLAQFRSEFIPEEDTQFAALANLLDDGTLAAAFRGTDNTLVGWKEDFNMSFQEAVPAQRLAVEYIEMLHERYGMPMSVCGHSKGGNLAMYAAAMSSPEIRQRIQGVYNNDGPGFQEHMLTTPGYLEMVPRIHTFVQAPDLWQCGAGGGYLPAEEHPPVHEAHQHRRRYPPHPHRRIRKPDRRGQKCRCRPGASGKRGSVIQPKMAAPVPGAAFYTGGFWSIPQKKKRGFKVFAQFHPLFFYEIWHKIKL